MLMALAPSDPADLRDLFEHVASTPPMEGGWATAACLSCAPPLGMHHPANCYAVADHLENCCWRQLMERFAIPEFVPVPYDGGDWDDEDGGDDRDGP